MPDAASLDKLAETAGDLVALVDDVAATGATGLAGLRALLGDLQHRTEAARLAGSFDATSLLPYVVVALQAERAIATDPTIKAVLSIVIFVLGKFAPPAPTPAPAPAS